MFLRGLFLLCLTTSVSGYVFKCLNDCECDTDFETIHCHNNRERQRLELPENKLPEYSFIGISNNDIRVLPSEELLKEKFPDLQAIDVEFNPNFDCSTLDHYKRIQILTDCEKDRDVELVNNKCDYKCQLKRHYDSLAAYMKWLWEFLQKKYGDLKRTVFGD